MDFSTMPGQNSLWGNTVSFGANNVASATTTTQSAPDKNKEKRFYDWHQKQGISAPQDYNTFASQPAPFSGVPVNPGHPTAASPFLQKVLNQQAGNLLNGGAGSNDADIMDGRRKPGIKRTASSSPPSSGGGLWPKHMFGTRPPSRTRARTSSTPDIAGDIVNEDNAPPLASIYDSYSATPAAADTKLPIESSMTPTQVRVANFSEDRFPDLIRALRRYYGPILEPYSGLPESESKFSDPEIIPRDQLDLATARMVQPMSGRDGGPGPWVRITFHDREAAERALDGSGRGELVVGGRTVVISLWEENAVVQPELPFAMEVEPTPAPTTRTLRRVSSTGSGRRPSMFEEPVEHGVQLSEHMPGAKLLVPKQVEFAKKDGWLGGWANALIGAGGAKNAPRSSEPAGGWGATLGRIYRYVMDEVVGFKYL